jgi:hypothetical protein
MKGTCNPEWGQGLGRAEQGQQEEAQQRTLGALAVLDGQAGPVIHPSQVVHRARPCLQHNDITDLKSIKQNTIDTNPEGQVAQAEVGQQR